MEGDPLLKFISSLSEKIKIEKEHKQLMEKLNTSSDSVIEPQQDALDPLDKVISVLKDKLVENKSVEPVVPVLEKISEEVVSNESASEIIPEPPPTSEEDAPLVSLVNKLKDLLVKPTEIKTTEAVNKTKDASETAPSADVSTTNDATQDDLKDEQTTDYVSELEKLSDTIVAEKEPDKINEIEKLIKKYAEKYLKKAAVMSEYAGGGGTNAVQFINGGTMNGDLNVNGSYLSGGVNLLNIFSGGGAGDSAVNSIVRSNSGSWDSTYTTVNAFSGSWSTGIQNLSFNDTNYDLSITSGNTVNLSALKDDLSEVASASGNWNSNYTTVKNTSAYWSQAYTNLTTNSASYLSGIDISAVASASGSWNSTYTTVRNTSSYWADTRQDVTFEKSVTINGNLSALGSSFFKNTLFTTTSALSVVSIGPGPALYVFQAAGPYDVASFYDGDGVEVLHVGNAQGGGNPLGKVGINTSDPTVELTVNGQISANNAIASLGGNSNQWNSNWSTTNSNSANWSNWGTVSANYIIDGGNARGAEILIGTNDAFNLNLETSGVKRLLITASGSLTGYNPQAAFNASVAAGTNAFAINTGNALGTRSFAQGNNSVALGTNSNARGSNTRASGLASSTEGTATSATNTNAHAEGTNTTASGQNSHAEGSGCIAGPNNHAHAEGLNTTASGIASHAEGEDTVASNSQAHAEGQQTTASGPYSHAEGYLTVASGQRSHAEGYNTQAQNFHSHSEGRDTIASGSQCHAEGLRSVAGPGGNAHAEGRDCIAAGDGSHAEGNNAKAYGINAHAEGSDTLVTGNYSHAAGRFAAATFNNTWVWHGNATAIEPVSTTRAEQFLVSATGGAFFPGNVGIGTDDNANALTVVGTISTNEHYSSLQWSSTYATVCALSAGWGGGSGGTTREYDYVQVGLNSYSYCGYAAPGTATSASSWTITRLYFSTAGTLLSSGAVTAAIWDNRYSYAY